MALSLPEDWIAAGATIEIELPRNLACASCSGGGCDTCERSGAVTIRGRKDPAETVEIKPKAGLVGNMDIIHMRNWLECVRAGRRETNCTAEHGYQHAIACIMADRALHTGRRTTFNESTRTIQEG